MEPIENIIAKIREAKEDLEKKHNGLPKRSESGSFLFCIKYRLTGSDTDITEIVEADNSSFVIPAFLMRFYNIDGRLTKTPGPEYVKVFGVDRDVKPVYTWTKPCVDATKRTIDNKVQPREKESIFEARCRAVGTDPKKTSWHALRCYENGLDPENTSMFNLECHKYKLDPKHTSINDLKNAGSKLFKH